MHDYCLGGGKPFIVQIPMNPFFFRQPHFAGVRALSGAARSPTVKPSGHILLSDYYIIRLYVSRIGSYGALGNGYKMGNSRQNLRQSDIFSSIRNPPNQDVIFDKRNGITSRGLTTPRFVKPCLSILMSRERRQPQRCSALNQSSN